MATPQAWGLGGRRDLPVVRSSPGIGPLVILAGLVAAPVGLAITLDGTTYGTWSAFIWAPVLMALAYPLCRWVASRTGEPELAGFLFGAAALKIVVGATARYYMVDSIYGGGDSFRYNEVGRELSTSFRRGIFEDLGQVTGTRFVEILTGGVQAVIGQTIVSSFLVFSAFGFVGMCFLYLAFCEAMPNGDRVLYRRLLFLTPTLWFWPSSIGKEAILLLFIGATAYGFARLLNGRLVGFALTALGLWGAAVTRPHIALMLLVGVVASLPPPLRRAEAGETDGRRRSIARVVLPLLVVAALPALLGSAERFFAIEGLNVDSADDVRNEVVRRTAQGGSAFVAPNTDNPIGLMYGVVTVAARPFPWEADGFQRLVAVENVMLAGVIGVAVVRRRFGLIKALGQRWPRFALGFVLAYAWGFSAVSNFGILARQRSLMLPFLFVLVAAVPRRTDPSKARRPATPATLAR